MRARTAALLGILILAVVLSGGALQAQSLPPTVVSFSADVASITVDEAEAGQTTTTLSWETVGVSDGQRIVLQVYGRMGWQPLLGTENAALPATGTYVDRIQNYCGFCSPTYRIAIVDGQNRILDQQIAMIEWAEPPGAPAITRFETGVQRIEANSLAQRTARVTVFWEVTNRFPNSNLVFEQVLEDGTAVSVEQPRESLWVGSVGQGEVIPVLPQTENYVQLRLRLVNAGSGALYDEAFITIPLIGAVTVPVVPQSPPQPSILAATGEVIDPARPIPENLPPEVLSFFVTPPEVERGGAVSVYWNVINARAVLVARLNAAGDPVEFYSNPALAGTWLLSLPERYVDSATFYLLAAGADEQVIERYATVRVQCPYTYFFGEARDAGCPRSGALEVSGAYQPFERGFMIWRGDTRQIFVFFNDTGRSLVVPDTWVEGEPLNILSQPPAGLYAPERGFGKVWLNTVEIMNGLGWATGPELSYAMRVQESGRVDDPRTFLALPDGRVVSTGSDGWGFIGN